MKGEPNLTQACSFRLFGMKLTQWIHEAFDLEIPTFAGDSSWKV